MDLSDAGKSVVEVAGLAANIYGPEATSKRQMQSWEQLLEQKWNYTIFWMGHQRGGKEEEASPGLHSPRPWTRIRLMYWQRGRPRGTLMCNNKAFTKSARQWGFRAGLTFLLKSTSSFFWLIPPSPVLKESRSNELLAMIAHSLRVATGILGSWVKRLLSSRIDFEACVLHIQTLLRGFFKCKCITGCVRSSGFKSHGWL